MDCENRIPRVRIHEDNFSEEIRNPSPPGERMIDGQPLGFIIEVVNSLDQVIALFFQAKLFNRIIYSDVKDYAKYYDNIVVNKIETEKWISNSEKKDYLNNKVLLERTKLEDISSWWNSYQLHDIAIHIIFYGRLKYPLGLDEENFIKYSEYIDSNYPYQIINLRYLIDDYADDLIDIVNFKLTTTKSKDNIVKINDKNSNFWMDEFIELGLEVISAVAGNLLAQDNIYFFIDEARHKRARNEFVDYYDSVINYLIEYKNKHFPLAKRSPQKQLFGIQRVKLLDSDSPQKMPSLRFDYFLDVVDSDGNTEALFFIVDGTTIGYDNLDESEGWESFSSSYDDWLIPNSQWRKIELMRWLPDHLEEAALLQLMNEIGISDENELINHEFPEGWWDYIDGDTEYGPITSGLPALFLMAYGRLKYPYKITKEIHDNCELYIRGFVERRYLLSEFTNLTSDPKEIGELFSCCVDAFHDKKSFIDACVFEGNYEEFIDCDLEILGRIADSILCEDYIDGFIDQAHTQNKLELKLYLLDYKNKHFSVRGQPLDNLPGEAVS